MKWFCCGVLRFDSKAAHRSVFLTAVSVDFQVVALVRSDDSFTELSGLDGVTAIQGREKECY